MKQKIMHVMKDRDNSQPLIYNAALQSDIKENVSEYAGKNIQEFIAECWLEALNNPTPRYYATEVAKVIRNEYKSNYPS